MNNRISIEDIRKANQQMINGEKTDISKLSKISQQIIKNTYFSAEEINDAFKKSKEHRKNNLEVTLEQEISNNEVKKLDLTFFEKNSTLNIDNLISDYKESKKKMKLMSICAFSMIALALICNIHVYYNIDSYINNELVFIYKLLVATQAGMLTLLLCKIVSKGMFAFNDKIFYSHKQKIKSATKYFANDLNISNTIFNAQSILKQSQNWINKLNNSGKNKLSNAINKVNHFKSLINNIPNNHYNQYNTNDYIQLHESTKEIKNINHQLVEEYIKNS